MQIPKIQFAKDKVPDIQVLRFSDLRQKLTQAIDHDLYRAHKIEFHFILIITQNTYTHFVDFKSYDIAKGSAIFVAKNQVHHFAKSIKDVIGISIIINSELIEKYHFLSDHLKLNRLFNYHIGNPLISPSGLGGDSLLVLIKSLISLRIEFLNSYK